MQPESTIDVVRVTRWIIFLFGLQFGLINVILCFRSWVELYWLVDLHVSSTSLAVIDIASIPIYMVYFLLFGHKTDNNVITNLSGKLRTRRGSIVFITLFLTFFSYYPLLFDPNALLSSYFNVRLNSIGLGVWFGILNIICKLCRRSWNVTMIAIGIEITSLNKPWPNDKYRTQLFGVSIALQNLGNAIGSTIPGYLNSNEYIYFLLCSSILYLVFAFIAALVIREPKHKTNTSNSVNDSINNICNNNKYNGENEESTESTTSKNIELIPMIIRCARNKPFLLIIAIEILLKSYVFTSTFIYKFYCNASNSDIATVSIVASVLSVLSSLFWTYLSSKWFENNNKVLIEIGFVMYCIAYVLYAFFPNDISNEFLSNPFIWIQSIVYCIGGQCWNTISPILLAWAIDFDEYLWKNRKEAIYQAILEQLVFIEAIWEAIGYLMLALVENANPIYFKLLSVIGVIPVLIAMYCIWKFPEKRLQMAHESMTASSVNNALETQFMTNSKEFDILSHFSLNQLKIWLNNDEIALLWQIKKEMVCNVLITVALTVGSIIACKYLSIDISLSLISPMILILLCCIIHLIISTKRLSLKINKDLVSVKQYINYVEQRLQQNEIVLHKEQTETKDESLLHLQHPNDPT